LFTLWYLLLFWPTIFIVATLAFDTAGFFGACVLFALALAARVVNGLGF
jgi:hypothetical protein